MNQPTTLHRVYVWELPVRFYHWVNALCVAALCVTGFMIGRPIVTGQGDHSLAAWRGLDSPATAASGVETLLWGDMRLAGEVPHVIAPASSGVRRPPCSVCGT